MDRTYDEILKNKFIRIRIGWNFQLSWKEFDIYLYFPLTNSLFSTRDRSGYDRFDTKEGIVYIFHWGFPGKNDRILFRCLIKDIQSIKLELKEGIYTRHVLYLEIIGQGAIPLTHMDENLTPRKIEQKAAELAYFLCVPIKVF
ncbi:Photosystem I assembly protein Ycf4 [Bienertia sinuspersici]